MELALDDVHYVAKVVLDDDRWVGVLCCEVGDGARVVVYLTLGELEAVGGGDDYGAVVGPNDL